jgi:light-regulated signal transduction histidine kinase (bacteriophytochrome)
VTNYHDVTAHREAETEITRLNSQLEQRIRERTAQLEAANQELEAFSYSVSHDLRTPLRHIVGFAQMQQDRPLDADPEESKVQLDRIVDSAKRMNKLIDDLLAFSHVARAELNRIPVNLGDAVQSVLSDFQHDLKDRTIDWDIGPLPEVEADPPMLRQVLVNLISNALKYTRSRARARVEVGCSHGDGEVVCYVRDNGVGFDARQAHKLFGVFQRLHRPSDFEGTGIGLANVRRIIHRHGGRTWAEGVVDDGATFYFSLPKPQFVSHEQNTMDSGS